MAAPVFTSLTSGVDATITTTPKVTASVTAAAGDLLLVGAILVNGTTGRTSTVTGTGLTWTKRVEGLFDTASNSVSIHSCVVPAGGFTGTLTITQNASIQQMHWSVTKVTGQHATTPVPQVAAINEGTGTTFTATTMGSPVDATDSRAFMVAGHGVQQAVAAGTNMTLLSSDAANSPSHSCGTGRSNIWLAAPTLTGASSGIWGAVAVEIAPAAGGTTFTQTPTGSLTPVGATTRVAQRTKSLTGGMSPTGAAALVRTRFKSLAADITFNTPSGTAFAWNDTTATWNDTTATWNSSALSRNFSLLVMYVRSGALSSTGTANRLKFIGKALTGALSPTGALVRASSLAKSGALSLTGLLIKVGLLVKAGSLTPTGTAARLKFVAKALAGVLSPTGTLVRVSSLLKSGSITPSGLAARSWRHVRAGSLSPAGATFPLRAYFRTLAGSLSPTGVAARVALRFKSLNGTLIPAGIAAKTAILPKIASITPSGQAVKAVARIFSGTIGQTGALGRSYLRTAVFSGALSPTGVAVKAAFRKMAGVLSLAGALTGSGAQQLNLSGALSPAATIARVVSRTRSMSATLSMSGALVTAASKFKSLTGALSPAGAITYARIRFVSVAGSLSPSATYVYLIARTRALGGTFAPSGISAKAISWKKTGVLSFSGFLSTGSSSFLNLVGALSPTGIEARQWGRSALAQLSLGNGVISMALARKKNIAGFITSSGNAQRFATLSRTLSGALSPTGALQLFGGAIITFAGTLNPSGAIKRASTKTLTGQTFTTGQANKMMIRSVAGAFSFVGTATRSTLRAKVVSGALTMSGAAVRSTALLRGGALNITGRAALGWRIVTNGAIVPTGVVTMTRARLITLVGALSFAGTTARLRIIPKVLSGTLSTTGAQVRATTKKLGGILQLVGIIAKVHFVGIAETVELSAVDEPQVLLIATDYRVVDFSVRDAPLVGVLAGES